MTEISDLEKAVLANPAVMAAIAAVREGDRSRLRCRPSDEDPEVDEEPEAW